MPLEEIIQRIKQETEDQIKEILRRAREEAEKILSQAEEARKLKEEFIQRAKLEAARLKDSLLSAAQLEFQKSILAEKQTILGEVFQQTVDRLQKLNSEEYLRVIEKLLLLTVETGEEEIIVSPRDGQQLDSAFLSRVNKQLRHKGKKGNLKLSEQTRPLGGGFILRSGKVENNNSFSTLVNQKREIQEREIVEILFGG